MIGMLRDQCLQVADVRSPVITLARLAVAETSLPQFDVHRAARCRLSYKRFDALALKVFAP